ncbi:clathrin heavy chain 1-like [Ptychodera flava]|uniref:clathrin heavy chain 1-like n=1 Tax=Ptychodera flava TaxID=63121 RepID=UPI00396AA8BA
MASDASGVNPSVVHVRSLIQLRDYEIKHEQINVQKVTMTSHKWVCCCHENRKDRRKRFIRGRVTVVNMQGKSPHPRSWPSTAESAAMNPTIPLLALKGGRHIEIFDLELKKMKYRCTMDSKIAYWTWVNAEVIAIVTNTAVYHWNIAGEREPSRVFQRNSRLRRCQLIAYKTDKPMRWMALTGLYKEDTGFVHGLTQLYSRDYQLSQCIDAYAVGFCEYRCNSNPTMSTVVCIATKTPGKQGKIHVLELGPHISGNSALSNHTDDVSFSQAIEFKHDFPVSLQISEVYGLVFILTKNGWLLLCDLDTGSHISTTKISQHVIFTTSLSSDDKGIVGVCKNGKVLSVKIKESSLLHHLHHHCKKINVATRLAQKFASTDTALLTPYTRYDTTV